ncbi:hypothetical protein DV515_00014553, partial [Chloebia gouldiae]
MGPAVGYRELWDQGQDQQWDTGNCGIRVRTSTGIQGTVDQGPAVEYREKWDRDWQRDTGKCRIGTGSGIQEMWNWDQNWDTEKCGIGIGSGRRGNAGLGSGPGPAVGLREMRDRQWDTGKCGIGIGSG